jgi:hypothetical protein
LAADLEVLSTSPLAFHLPALEAQYRGYQLKGFMMTALIFSCSFGLVLLPICLVRLLWGEGTISTSGLLLICLLGLYALLVYRLVTWSNPVEHMASFLYLTIGIRLLHTVADSMVRTRSPTAESPFPFWFVKAFLISLVITVNLLAKRSS